MKATGTVLALGVLLGCTYDASRLRPPVRGDAGAEVVPVGEDVPPLSDALATESDVAVDRDAAAPADTPVGADTPASDDAADVGDVLGTGGVVGTGGTSATGGLGATGGSGGSGGAGGSGRTWADAGPEVAPDTAPSTVVTFVDGKAQGAFWGAAFASLGRQDKLSSPTCGEVSIAGQVPAGDPALALTPGCPPEQTTWSTSDALCVTGEIPAWPPVPTDKDYDNNWGVLVGVDTREPRQGMGVAYRSIKLTATGSPSSGLRALIHRSGDPVNLTYCAKVTLGAPINFSSFNTHCWDNSGVSLLPSEVVDIDMVALLVASAEYPIAVRDLCLTRIDLAK